MFLLPVANGILPRPYGGKVIGMFLAEQIQWIKDYVDIGDDILICPWVLDTKSLYPVGVVARVNKMDSSRVFNEELEQVTVVFIEFEGREHARWKLLDSKVPFVCTSYEMLDFKVMRKEYPVISGAGWHLEGGYTEFRHKEDIPVTIYGTDLETQQKVFISANLGGIATQEQAHTIEHAIIRALNLYGLCTARTLLEAIIAETNELKASVEYGIENVMPEVFGVTASGACGNPLTNLAQVYLAEGFMNNVKAGRSLNESIENARRTTMSQLTQDVGLTMNRGIRTLQGLKKGMAHDDTQLRYDKYKKIIARFPLSPWQ